MPARFGWSAVIRADLAYDLSSWSEMIVQHQSRWRSFFATVCLLAVVLLYAPFGRAAWALYSAACCKSGSQCPTHGHHHSQTPATPERAMDCGNEMAGMAHCSMSCCHNPDRPAVAPAIFVLPTPVTVSVAATLESLIALSSPQSSVNSFEPPSPPPRLCPLAA